MLDSLKSSYRRCSVYIHGDVTTSDLLPTQIIYSDEIVSEWLTIGQACMTSMLHIAMVRYYLDLTPEQRGKVESSLEDERFSSLISVRRLIGLPVESDS